MQNACMKVQQEANHLQLQLCDIARMMCSFSVAPFIQTASWRTQNTSPQNSNGVLTSVLTLTSIDDL